MIPHSICDSDNMLWPRIASHTDNMLLHSGLPLTSNVEVKSLVGTAMAINPFIWNCRDFGWVSAQGISFLCHFVYQPWICQEWLWVRSSLQSFAKVQQLLSSGMDKGFKASLLWGEIKDETTKPLWPTWLGLGIGGCWLFGTGMGTNEQCKAE